MSGVWMMFTVYPHNNWDEILGGVFVSREAAEMAVAHAIHWEWYDPDYDIFEGWRREVYPDLTTWDNPREARSYKVQFFPIRELEEYPYLDRSVLIGFIG